MPVKEIKLELFDRMVNGKCFEEATKLLSDTRHANTEKLGSISITENEPKRVVRDRKLELFDLLIAMRCEENAVRLLCAIRCISEMELMEALCINAEEDDYFSMLFTKLFNRSLITEEQKQEFLVESQAMAAALEGTEVFENAEPLDSKEQLNFESANENKDVAVTAKKVVNPMSLIPVIGCVLKYLNVKDIKSCRLLSRKWNVEAQPILRTRSAIRFLKSEMDLMSEGTLFYPFKYLELFSETLEALPFTAFKICGDANLPWTINELNEFFELQKENIRELDIQNLHLTKKDRNYMLLYGAPKVKRFDISPWIESCAMSEENGEFHTKLHVDSPNLKVQTAILANIKELSLIDCQVIVQEKRKLYPVDLALKGVQFFQAGKKLADICVNDIIDFSRIKRLNLQAVYGSTEICLKLNGELNLDYLRLYGGISVINWMNCAWTVKKLVLKVVSFIEKTAMQIQELHFFYGEIDISILPVSIEKLIINYIPDMLTCSSSQKIILEKLHYFSLNFWKDEDISLVFQIIQFPNIVDLSLGACNTDDQLEIDLAWIPKSVRRLTLSDVKVTGERGKPFFNLEKLILMKYAFSDVSEICTCYFQAQELIIHCTYESVMWENILDFLEYLEYRKRSSYRQRIYVGRLLWQNFQELECNDEDISVGDFLAFICASKEYYDFDCSFEWSPLIHYVDKKAEYYVFENEKGKALNDNDGVIEAIGKIHTNEEQ